MSYTALYRKFRPGTFDEVKGQDHVVRTLRNQVRTGRLQHAYLFCGTRGTGKTSVAKILARAVNCLNPEDGNPCGKCANCRAIANGTSMNVIEIDAASNNGVDNIREIIDEVQYRPTEGNYRVYIIDEVHMLSAGAFNALLKTLEEPPSYVIFILATTEAGKIPVTILSRCQRYDFRRIDVNTITSRMRELMEHEGVEAEDRALRFIARAADGSMRDALSLLDRCIAFYMDEPLTYGKVLEVLGEADTEVFGRLTRCVSSGDAGGAMRVFGEQVSSGVEIGQFVTDYIRYLRNLLIASMTTREEAAEVIDASDEQLDDLKAASEKIDSDTVMRYIRILSELQNRMRYVSNRRVPAEVAILEMARPEGDRNPDALSGRLRRIESRLDELEESACEPRAVTVRPAQEAEAEKKETEPLPDAAPDDLRRVLSEWNEVVDGLPAGTPLRQQLRENATPQFNAETLENRLFVEFGTSPKQEMGARLVTRDESVRLEFEEYLERRYGKHISVEMHLAGGGTSALKNVDLDQRVRTNIHFPNIETEADDGREE